MIALFESAICPQFVLTLGHFLWQGVAVGGLAWLAGRALRCGSSSARYRVFLAALVVMAVCPPITFLWLGRESIAPEARPEPVAVAESTARHPRELPHIVPADPGGGLAGDVDKSPRIIGERIDAAEAGGVPVPEGPAETAAEPKWRLFAVWLTSLYLAGVLLMLIRLALGLDGGRRLRRRSERVADSELLEMLARRSAEVGLRPVPILAWCRDIAVPTVVGVIRPAILLPASLATGLTPDQLAQILTHELAHIQRWDPLVNLFQRIVEAVLFFHPMIWYVSRRVRQERENCCDDLVLATGADPVGYASALLEVAERAVTHRQRAAAGLAVLRANGEPSDLGGRIRRLLDTEQHEALRLNRPGLMLTVATATLLVLAGLSLLAVNAGEEVETETPSAVMSKDEQTAWRELEATDVWSAEALRRRSIRRQLASLERMNFPETHQKKVREKLERPVRSASFRRVPAEVWPLIGRLESLHDLTVIASDLRGEAYRHITRLPNLRRITVRGSKCLPTDAEALKAAPTLEHVDFVFTIFGESAERRQELLGELTEAEQSWAETYRLRRGGREHIIEAAILTDRLLEKLRDLPGLRSLRLVNTSISGRGVEAIGVHEQLEELDVNIVDFTPEAARAIGQLTQLRKFRYADASDETLAALAGLTKLEELELWAKGVTDAGIRHVVPMESLRKLTLRGSSISDAGLKELAELPHLERLDLSYAKGSLTRDGIAQFQRLKPQCSITANVDEDKASPAESGASAASAVAPAGDPHGSRDVFAESITIRVAGT